MRERRHGERAQDGKSRWLGPRLAAPGTTGAAACAGSVLLACTMMAGRTTVTSKPMAPGGAVPGDWQQGGSSAGVGAPELSQDLSRWWLQLDPIEALRYE